MSRRSSRQCHYGHVTTVITSMSLRSSRQPLLEIRRFRTEYGLSAFSVAAAENRNKLLIDIQLSDTS